MVEYADLLLLCRIYHWLRDGRCELMELREGGTYNNEDVVCCEEKCPILAIMEKKCVLRYR
jgi:hypothetical protein